MLKNMKVGKSLVLGFGITIVVSVIIIAVSLIMMMNLSGQYDDLLATEVVCNEEILYARLYANIAARNVRDILLIPDDSINPQLVSETNGYLGDLDTSLDALENAWPDGASTTELNTYITATNTWSAIAVDILGKYDQYATTGSQTALAEAIQMVSDQCTPALNTMADHAKAVDALLVSTQEGRIDDITRMVTITLVVLVVAAVAATVAVVIFVLMLVRNITGPTEEVRAALVGFSQGKFDIPVEFESRNELGEMCNALRTSQTVLKDLVADVDTILSQMAQGNFDVHTRKEDIYVGGLRALLNSMRALRINMSETLAQIILSAEQVNAGSEQVSTGAQALAQGATEQASAVQELSATIQEIASAARHNSENSSEALSRSLAAGGQVEESTQYMQEMVDAMDKISHSSEEIAKIIATIENIAFQTNILALNAAVEAARAGSAGKGFAVVADEVRNLSAKSDQAAKATKELIDNSVSSVQEGNAIVRKVSDSLAKTMELAGLAMDSMKLVAKAVEEETEAIAQVTEGIDQISSVVQTNSATSEQSAAASEELSSQVTMVKGLMSKFKLSNTDAGVSAAPASHSYTAEPVVESSTFSKY